MAHISFIPRDPDTGYPHHPSIPQSLPPRDYSSARSDWKPSKASSFIPDAKSDEAYHFDDFDDSYLDDRPLSVLLWIAGGILAVLSLVTGALIWALVSLIRYLVGSF